MEENQVREVSALQDRCRPSRNYRGTGLDPVSISRSPLAYVSLQDIEFSTGSSIFGDALGASAFAAQSLSPHLPVFNAGGTSPCGRTPTLRSPRLSSLLESFNFFRLLISPFVLLIHGFLAQFLNTFTPATRSAGVIRSYLH